MSFISLIFCVLTDALLPLTPALDALLSWAAGTAALIAAVLLTRHVLKNRLSERARYALWAVVLLRALLPFQLPFALPVSVSEVLPTPTDSFQTQSVPAPFSTSEPIEQAQHYYQGLAPGYVGPTTGSMGYVEISEDGETIHYYVDLFSPAEIVRIVWLAGAAVTAGVLIVSNGRFHNKLRKSRRELEVADCPIPVYVAEELPSPCLVGVLCPAVYLTEETAADETKLRHVLTHELTHYAHKDHLWSALRCMCLTFHWFNPLAWWAAAESKKDCELACDEGAVKRLGETERIPYGRTLVDMVAARNGYDLLSCSTTMTGGKKTIQQRIEALVKHPETKAAAAFLAVSLLAVLGLAVFADKTENLDPNSNLTSSEEGYAMLEEHLRDDLPIHLLSPDDDGGYITDAGVGTAAKAYLRGDLRPLEDETEPTDFAPLFDSLHTLDFYYETGEEFAVRSRFFYLGPWQDGHYIFLREENRAETPMLIPVGTVSPRTAETLMAFLDEQREFDRKEWETPQQGYYRYGKALDDLAAVGVYGKKSGLYSSLNSKRYEQTLEQILSLLRQVSQVPTDMEDFTVVTGNRIVLFDTLGAFTAAGWNTREYHLAQADGRYYLTILYDGKHYAPIASMSEETWEKILHLVEHPDEPLPEPEPEVKEIKYYVDDPAQVQALIDLFLNDPETIDSHGGEKLVDWLTNWTHGFTVVYGDPYWSHNGEQVTGWYAKAVDAGSFFPITVRDGLVEDVLSICGASSQNEGAALAAFLNELDGLFYVTMYDSMVDIDTYAFFLTVSEQSELDAVKVLLRNSCTVLENPNIPLKPTADYILLDTDSTTSPAPEYMIRTIEDHGNILYHTSHGKNIPIAAVSDSAITELRRLADPDREPHVVTGITILGSGSVQYELEDPERIAALSALFLSDTETVERNESTSYDMTQWLTHWTTHYYVEYGKPLWRYDRNARWFARATTPNGSFYHIEIPDHLLKDMQTICGASEQGDRPSPIDIAASLRAEDIDEVIAIYPVEPELNELLSALRAAVSRPIIRTYDYQSHGLWQLTLRLKGANGESYVDTGDNELTLYAGQEENVVALYYHEVYRFVSSAALYDLVLSLQPRSSGPMQPVLP